MKSKDLTLRFIFNGRGSYGISKTSDWNQTSRSAKFSNLWINIKSGKNNTDENQGDRTPGTGHILV